MILLVVAVAVVACFLFFRATNNRKKSHYWTLSASYIAAAIGVHPYKSQQELFDEMTGRVARETRGEDAKNFGIRQEQTAFSVYQALYSSDVVDGNAYGLLQSPSLQWLRGYADGLIYEGERLVGVLEIKCRYSKSDEAVPYQRLVDLYYYLPQVQAYMEMTNTQFCDLMSYTRRGSTLFRVYRDPDLWYLIALALAKFRECLILDQPPKAHDFEALQCQIKERLIQCDWDVPQAAQLWDDE